MFFAPIIDAALTRENALKLGAPILFLVFGWSFAYSFNATRSLVVGLEGFGAMSGLTLVGIYVFARVFRLLEWEKRISTRVAVGVLIATLPLTAIRFGTYDSPVVLVVAAALFTIASRWRIGDGFVAKVVAFLTPSLFAIYILQVNSFAWQVYPIIVKSAISFGIPQIVLFPLMTFGLFVTCLITDLIRRVIVRYAI